MPKPSKIFLIRHAEKPKGEDRGVLPDGQTEKKALTVRGWQRAGALALYFRGAGDDTPDNPIEKPQCLFASPSSSLRPQQTLLPLAGKLGLSINVQYGKGDEEALVREVVACTGPVLICWQHEYMAAVANAVVEDRGTVPQEWPAERFDITWMFALDRSSDRYQLTQIPQLLLAGDSPTLI